MINTKKLVKDNLDNIIEDIKKLVRVNSIFDEESVSENMPYGKNVNNVFEEMTRLCEQYGFKVNNVGNRVLELTIQGESDKTFGIMSHLDTVPVTNNWETNPFEVTIKDNKLYGRGTSDDKGPSVMVLWALKIFKEMNLVPQHTIKVLFGGDEERGSSDLDYYFSKNKEFDFGFSPDTDFPIIFLEKALSVFEFEKTLNSIASATDKYKLVKFSGGTKINVVCDFIEAIIECSSDKDKMKLITKLNKENVEFEENDNTLSLFFYGKAAHAKIPSNGINAAFIGAKFLKNVILDKNGNEFIRFLNDYFTDDTSGTKLGIYESDEFSESTNNLGLVSYDGVDVNIQINYRSSMGTNLDNVNSKVKKVGNLFGYNVNVIDQEPVHYVDKNSLNAKMLSQAYYDIMGEEVGFAVNGGRTYASKCKNTMAFGPLFKHLNSQIHSDCESLDIYSIENVTAIYLQIMLNMVQNNK